MQCYHKPIENAVTVSPVDDANTSGLVSMSGGIAEDACVGRHCNSYRKCTDKISDIVQYGCLIPAGSVKDTIEGTLVVAGITV